MALPITARRLCVSFPIQEFILLNHPNVGPGTARNYGLNLAKGEWILFLDADDLIEPTYFSNRLNTALDNPSANIVAGCWEEFSDDFNTRTYHRPAGSGGNRSNLENSAIAAAPWALHATIVKRSHLIPDLTWPEEMDKSPSEDTAFWFPLILGAAVAFTDQAGALYRVQTENSRNYIIDIHKWVTGVISVIHRNTNVLTKKCLMPNQLQIASIVRALESNYRMSIRRSDRVSATLALNEANSWLRHCQYLSVAIALRKILGMRLFNLLRYGTI